jgi:DNA-binding NtrC family response regulator
MPKTPRKPATSTTARDQKPAEPWILVVDDEAMVRRVIDSVLGSRGWPLKLADGAEAAMKLVDESDTPPAVLVCDVLMPKIDGLELTRRLTARVPKLSAILISGHLADSAWWPADMGRIRLLKKPFPNEELISAVEEALENHRLQD